MAWHFGSRSNRNLSEVHPDLQRVMRRALELSPVDFAVTDGRRTNAEQAALKARGASQTLNSRHITGHAVDVAAFVGGKARWSTALYVQIWRAVEKAAAELSVPVKWGGNWRTFKDAAHFELDRATYP